MANYGNFGKEEVIAKWLKHSGKDRKMELVRDFTYIDPKGISWTAEIGDKINGASIPSWAWGKKIGTPYVGDFRRASVIHDVECDKKRKPHKDVHKMFYYAMRCDGVSKKKALLMYRLVAMFGPKWDAHGVTKEETRKLDESVLQTIENTIDRTLEETTGSLR